MTQPSYLEARANLSGRAAMIIGGAGGLGRACTIDLARAGVDVAVLDRDRLALESTSDECRSAGHRVLTHVGDARDEQVLAAFFDQVDREFGRLDVLLNVVGGTFLQPFSDSTPRGWDALMRANFVWLLHAIHLAIPRLRARGGGSIISITSIEGHRAGPGVAIYAAMKAAVTNLSRSLAVELASDGIRVNTIAPDLAPHEGTATHASFGTGSVWTEDDASRFAVTIPMGRTGTAHDVSGCALFLASDLSSYVTGTSIHPDGGTLAASGWLNWPEVGYSNLPPASAPRS
ncbi:MAG: SDR family NAD(P)-dependent oxidoreductase [Ilumatobacteraceae bacterium]